MDARAFILSACVIHALQGCSNMAVEKCLDAKISKEAAISSGQDLESESRQLLEDFPRLNEEKRLKLDSLRENTISKLEFLKASSLKYRSLLIKDLLASDYDQREVKLLKVKVEKIEQERLNVFFAAVSQANLILGRWPSKATRLDAEFAPEREFPPR